MLGRLILVHALLAFAAHASAQEDGDSGDARAQRLFVQGRDAFDAERYAEALDFFQRSYEISGRHELLNNIGSAQERLGRYDAAIRTYERFLEAVPSSSNRSFVERRLSRLREGAAREEPPPPPPERGSSNGGDATLLAVGIATAVIGAVVTAVGVGGVVVRENAAAEYNSDACDPTPDAPSSELRCGGLRSDGDVWGTAGGVLLAIGGAALAAGVALAIIGATSTTADVAAACSPTLGGVVCGGRF
jgi:tetratricopeptide (TPR) repeat protein